MALPQTVQGSSELPTSDRQGQHSSLAVVGGCASLGRLRRLIEKAGGIPKHARACPECGGKVVMTDDLIIDQQNGRPMRPKSMRYLITCTAQHCVSVTGPTVRWTLRQWVDGCTPNAPVRDAAQPRSLYRLVSGIF